MTCSAQEFLIGDSTGRMVTSLYDSTNDEWVRASEMQLRRVIPGLLQLSPMDASSSLEVLGLSFER
ncbi:Galactose oxidase/kelch beta-propeller [Penicillium verrucosum]|uniref:Galactose oxidase/kelch beta-propeller n=1 Tax=Penicillium verrucosum TaxID=60171 RepID=UPI00254508CA|nr:Galactose oxidase/kelch beta-propeller [Penicillium verrucosum]KAJ5945488.1 Galactose oxidase/kelch beta-propeller [Penicillium verrucosum]